MKIDMVGIVTSVFPLQNGGQVLTIEEGNSTIKLNSGDVDLSTVPMITPLHILADVRGRSFGKNFWLSCVSFVAEKV